MEKNCHDFYLYNFIFNFESIKAPLAGCWLGVGYGDYGYGMSFLPLFHSSCIFICVLWAPFISLSLFPSLLLLFSIVLYSIWIKIHPRLAKGYMTLWSNTYTHIRITLPSPVTTTISRYTITVHCLLCYTIRAELWYTMHCTWFSLLNYELLVFIVSMCVRSNTFVCSGFIHYTMKLQLFVYCWQSLALSCSAISFTPMVCCATLHHI